MPLKNYKTKICSRLTKLKILLTIIFISRLSISEAQIEAFCGIWSGKLNYHGLSLTTVYVIEKRQDSIVIVVDSPDQYVKDIPVEKWIYKNDSLRLRSKTTSSEFVGKYNAEAEEFKGYFKQNGIKLPLTLKKTHERISWKRPQEPKTPLPYISENIDFKSLDKNFTMHGTLTIPYGKGPFPVVVMVSGSGWQDRNESLMGHQPFYIIADYLARNGIASLRYDDRLGNGTSLDFSYDAEGGVKYLLNDIRFDSKRIGVLGHSEGGTIAYMLASRMKEIGFIISLAGVTEAIPTLIYQAREILKVNGVSEEIIDCSVNFSSDVYKIIQKTKNGEKINNKVDNLLEEYKKQYSKEIIKNSGLNAQNIKYQISSPWFLYFLRIDRKSVV